MTAKKKKAGEPVPEFPEMTSAEWEIEDFLEEWGPQTAVVEIYRRKDDGSMPHIRRVDIGIITADLFGYLRQHFGNGKYVLMFKNEARRVVKRLTIEVEGADVKPGAPVSNGSSTFEQQMILALIAAQRPAPPLDVGALMAGIGAMMGSLKPAASDPAAMLTAMATTFQQLKPEGDGVDKALTIISKAKEIGGGGNNGDGGETWPGLIKEGLTTAAALLQNRAASNPAALPAQVRPAVPPGAVPVTSIPQTASGAASVTEQAPTTNPDELLKQWLTAQIGFLKMKARAGKNPDDWADYTEDNAEEPGCAAILEALRRGATLQHLLTFDPEIGKDPLLAGWFQRYYESLQAPIDETMDSSGTGGDAGNPPGHEKPSP